MSELKQYKKEEFNPFIGITPAYRAILVSYFVIYIVYQPAVFTYIQDDLTWSIYIIDLLYSSLLFLPILFYRKEYGWLHPLIFPLVFSIARAVGSNPITLLGVFYSDEMSSYASISHVLLYSWRQHDINFVYVYSQIINIVAIISYYVAYFYLPKLPELKVKFKQPRGLIGKVAFITFLSIAIFIIYLQYKGGIDKHLLSWASGRFNALAGDGPIFVLVKMAPYAILIWYTFDRKAERKVLFWIALIITAPMQFILNGSRSSIIYLGAIFVLAAIWKQKKIPQIRIFVFVLLAIVIIGLLGNIRSSTFSGKVEWTSALDKGLVGLVEDTHEEIARRGESNGYLAVVAKVPDEVDYLYGESYVSAILFFVPRFIWENKPRGAGAISGERIFNKSSGAGIPPGPVGEAYWNFSIFGVALIFLLYGLFHKWLANNMIKYSAEPGYFVFYIITLTIFSPTGIAIVSYFQTVIPVIIILYWAGAIDFNKNQKSYN